MAWGVKGGRGVDDLIERLNNDPSMTTLHIFASRKFGREVRRYVDLLLARQYATVSLYAHILLLQEVQKLSQALHTNACLKELYASGHRLTPETAGMLGAMLAANASLVSFCAGDDALGDAVSASSSWCLLTEA